VNALPDPCDFRIYISGCRSPAQKQSLQLVAEVLGATVQQNMDKTCTHLLLVEFTSEAHSVQKYTFALRAGMTVVSSAHEPTAVMPTVCWTCQWAWLLFLTSPTTLGSPFLGQIAEVATLGWPDRQKSWGPCAASASCFLYLHGGM
jgi:hypothetical protein